MKHKILNMGANLSLFFSLSVLVLFLCWMIFPLKVTTVESPVVTDKQEYKVGETIKYDLDFCIYKKTKVTISKRFVDGTVHFMPSYDIVSGDMGCHHNDKVVGAVIPLNLEPGEYILEITALHYVNPIRDFSVMWETEPFQIIEGY